MKLTTGDKYRLHARVHAWELCHSKSLHHPRRPMQVQISCQTSSLHLSSTILQPSSSVFTAMSHTYICTTLLLLPDIAYPFMPSAKVVIISASGSICPAVGLSAIIYHNTTTPHCDISKRLTYAVLPPWLSIHPIDDLFIVSNP